jgi:hypothetical protein
LFPVDEDFPRLIQIDSSRKAEYREIRPNQISMFFTHKPNLRKYLEITSQEQQDTMDTQLNLATAVNLVHTLFITRRKDHDGHPINTCVKKLTEGKTGDFWKGPVVTWAMIYTDQTTNSPLPGQTIVGMARGEQAEDVSLADLHHIWTF